MAETIQNQASQPIAVPPPYDMCEKLIINVVDGHSFDPSYQKYKVDRRRVINVSVGQIQAILGQLELELDSKKVDQESLDGRMDARMDTWTDAQEIGKTITRIGYGNTTLNFECCTGYGKNICGSASDCQGFKIALDNKNEITACRDTEHYHYTFGSLENTLHAIDLIVLMIKNGAQVICSDFAAKALIANWDDNKLGAKCPFRIVGTISGSIRVRYGIDECRKCIFPQLATLAWMALPDHGTRDHDQLSREPWALHVPQVSSMTMEAMGNTLVYGVDKKIDKNLKVEIMSVAVGKVVCQAYHHGDDLFPLVLKKLKRHNACINPSPGRNQDSMPDLPSPDSTLPVPVPWQQHPETPGSRPTSDNSLCSLYAIDENHDDITAMTIARPTHESGSLQSMDFLPLSRIKSAQPNNRPLTPDSSERKIAGGCGVRETVIGFEPEIREHFISMDTVPDLNGLPVHTIVGFMDMPGSLIISSLHLCNLLAVNTNIATVLETATTVLGRRRSDQLATELHAATLQGPKLLRAVTAACVSEITASSLNCYLARVPGVPGAQDSDPSIARPMLTSSKSTP
jgi:hypothetical protein